MKPISKNQIEIKCHDDKAVTYDRLDINLFLMGKDYFECTREYSDYELYDDEDIEALYSKIDKQWGKIKHILYVYRNSDTFFDTSFKQDGFCVVFEPVFEGDEVDIGQYGYKKSENGYDIEFGDTIQELGKELKNLVENSTVFNIRCRNYTRSDFHFIEFDICDDDLVTLVYSVDGGYERDTGAYYGGEEYVDALMSIVNIPNNIEMTYSLDHEDLSGTITIKYKD